MRERDLDIRRHKRVERERERIEETQKLLSSK